MGICWYCYCGWAVPVRELYADYLAKVGESAMHFGPAHIVWEDENFGDDSIDCCIKECDSASYPELTLDQLAGVRQSLVRLRAIPENIRCCEPDDYDGKHPENFPPKIPMRR